MSRPTISLRLDISWLPATALVLWWLATMALPNSLPELARWEQWLLAALLTLCLFVSVALHEIVRIGTGLRYGIEPRTFRLYPFGGIPQEDPGIGGPEAEFMTAVSGPATHLVTAFCLLVLADANPEGSVAAVVTGYLSLFNAVLGLAGLLPAFPLDGGRALRAVLWALRNDFGWATTVASRTGSAAGLFLAAVGVFMILTQGAPIGGLTALLVGLTIRSGAVASHRQQLTRRSLGTVPVRHLMDQNPVTVQRALSIASLVDDFIYKHQLKMLPVVDGERLFGYVTAQRVKELPREEWVRQSIGTIAMPVTAEDTVSPDSAAIEALDKMTRSGLTRLMVVDDDRLAGTISLQDLLRSLHSPAASETGGG